MRRDHDVLIAGAGPAGAHLALRLARAGWSVALLDKRRFPRPKPCGEFLGPDCVPLLEEVGLAGALRANGARRIRSMQLHGFGRDSRGCYGSIACGTQALDHGYSIRREVLDELTVRAAERQSGVELLEGHAAGALLRASDGRVVGATVRDPAGEMHELRAAFTIGADGIHSALARQLGAWRRIPGLERYALTTHVPRAGLTDHSELFILDDGYFVLSPVDGELASLNLVVGRNSMPGGRRELADFLARRVRSTPGLAERVQLAPDVPIRACGPLAARSTAQAFDGAALVGDAAGFVDPITGEGTYFAMRGAALLAGALDAALHARRTDAGALRSYERARRAEFAHRRALDFAIQHALRRPRVTRAVLGLLAARPGCLDLLMAITGNAMPPKELLRPAPWLAALRSA